MDLRIRLVGDDDLAEVRPADQMGIGIVCIFKGKDMVNIGVSSALAIAAFIARNISTDPTVLLSVGCAEAIYICDLARTLTTSTGHLAMKADKFINCNAGELGRVKVQINLLDCVFAY